MHGRKTAELQTTFQGKHCITEAHIIYDRYTCINIGKKSTAAQLHQDAVEIKLG